MNIQINDVVSRTSDLGFKYADVGDVIEKKGDRCRVAWRDKLVPNFYRPEEMSLRPGKRTWVNQKFLTKV